MGESATAILYILGGIALYVWMDYEKSRCVIDYLKDIKDISVFNDKAHDTLLAYQTEAQECINSWKTLSSPISRSRARKLNDTIETILNKYYSSK